MTHHLPNATAIGSIAVFLWATLGLLTSQTTNIPPFQWVFLVFFLASLFFCALLAQQKKLTKKAFQAPWPLWILGPCGLFGYHLFYFSALRYSPGFEAEANLINYLWPLLIVLFSAALPTERLRWFHVGGALLGFLGLLILNFPTGATSATEGVSQSSPPLIGISYALLAAIIWAGYSVLSRLFKNAPTELILPFCFVTSIAALFTHLGFESWVSPSLKQWLFLSLLAWGPMGASFFVWDYGLKKGNIQLLGTIAYLTPLLSTALFILFNAQTQVSIKLLLATFLVFTGALLASLNVLFPLVKTHLKKGKPSLSL